jgi:hypothetical protein
MSAIVRSGQHALSMIEMQTQGLDLALRAAAALKGARGLLPDALKTEGEIVAVLLAGQELGLPPMASLRGLQVVRGKVIISYDTMVALLRRAGYRIEWLVTTATEASLRLTAPDGAMHTERWDEARARKAGLWGQGTWGKYPETMLRARCVSSAARAFAGEVLAGVYVEEAGEREEIATVASVHVIDAPSQLTASSLRQDDEVREQSTVAERLRDESRRLRDALAPELDKLVEEGTADDVEEWCYRHGHHFASDLRGSDHQYLWRRLLKAEKRLALPFDTVKAWLSAREPKAPSGEIPAEYDGMFAELIELDAAEALEQWCTSYKDDLHALENGARKAAWELIRAAARQCSADEDAVKAWLR